MNENAQMEVLDLSGDSIVQIAQAAEKRIEAVKKIKQLALRITNAHDWTNQGDRPYLQVSGAEKVRGLFNISWALDEPQFEIVDDEGHYQYTYKGTFTMGTSSIEAIGTRSSKDLFFSGSKTPKKPQDIDRGDVKKSAYTNCIGNGITRILGIRNLTWEDLAEGGIQKSAVTEVRYNTAGTEMNQAAVDQKGAIWAMVLEMVGGNEIGAGQLLEKITTWTNREGKAMAGVVTVERLTEKQIPVIYGKVKTAHDKYLAAQKGAQADAGERNGDEDSRDKASQDSNIPNK